MDVETSDSTVAEHLTAIASVVRASGGFIARDFTVHEHRGDYWCSIKDQPAVAGRLLVDYPAELTIPLSHIDWADNATELVPVGGLARLSLNQRELLERWLALMNSGNRMTKVGQRLPRHAIADPEVRVMLADAGYPGFDIDELSSPVRAIRQDVVSWHSVREHGPKDQDGRGSHGLRLIPLKQLLNHHPRGAPQLGLRRRDGVAVTTGSNSSAKQTYENYGDLDALQLLMSFGYVDDTAELVHSVPVSVDGGPLGRVSVVARAPRKPRAVRARDIPVLSRSGGETTIRDLAIRPGSRSRARALVTLAMRSSGELNESAAARVADDFLDSIVAANLDYYDRLITLLGSAHTDSIRHPVGVQPRIDRISRATTAPGMLLAVAELQKWRLTSWWA
jgi:hypothetical protein